MRPEVRDVGQDVPGDLRKLGFEEGDEALEMELLVGLERPGVSDSSEVRECIEGGP